MLQAEDADPEIAIDGETRISPNFFYEIRLSQKPIRVIKKKRKNILVFSRKGDEFSSIVKFVFIEIVLDFTIFPNFSLVNAVGKAIIFEPIENAKFQFPESYGLYNIVARPEFEGVTKPIEISERANDHYGEFRIFFPDVADNFISAKLF